MSEKHGLNQVPKELSSTRNEKANTHEHGMNYSRWCMVSVVFRGGGSAFGWAESMTGRWSLHRTQNNDSI